MSTFFLGGGIFLVNFFRGVVAKNKFWEGWRGIGDVGKKNGGGREKRREGQKLNLILFDFI